MAKITVHAGDLPVGKASSVISSHALVMSFPWQAGDGLLGKSITIIKTDIDDVSQASEENVKSLGGTIGWGAVGATLLGPAGLLAGLIMGGKGKEVTFIIKLKDGRKALATTDSKSFTKLQALCF